MISAFFHLLSNSLKRQEIVISRSDDELEYLLSWLRKDHTADNTIEPVGVEVDKTHIHSIIQSCQKCNAAGEKKISFGSGANGVMIILHLPEKVTSSEMKLYRNDANELMKKMMAAINVNISECYLTNLIKCEGSVTHQPSAMFVECSNLLREEISEMNPSVIVVMGSFAPVARMAKELSSIKWFNIEHPVTVIKNPDLKRSAWETLKLVRSALEKPAQ